MSRHTAAPPIAGGDPILDWASVWAVAERGTRTPEYEQTLVDLARLLAVADALDDRYTRNDVLRLILMLTERGNYIDWAAAAERLAH